MALFIAYTISISAMIFLSCHLVEACVTVFGLPTRFVWAFGIAIAGLLPVASVMRVRAQPEVISAPITASVVQASAVEIQKPPAPLSPTVTERLVGQLQSLDGFFVGLWLLGSFVTLCAVAVLALRTRRIVRSTKPSRLQAVSVRESQHIGPALVGIFRYEIVLPRWVFGLSPDQQLLILRHEQEHAQARDPLLVWLTALAVVVVPWNVPVWYLMRRLRTSIEIDCDRRVLRLAPEPQIYGSLLLDISSRNTSRHFFAAAFGESGSQLHRRIRAMSSIRRPMARTIGVLSAALAIILVAGAFRAPKPRSPGLPAAVTRTFLRSSAVAKKSDGERSTASVAVTVRGGSGDFLIYTTGGARVGIRGAAPQVIADTIQLRAPISLTADLTDGDVHIVSVTGWPVDVNAIFFHGAAIQASANWRHVILEKGGVGVSGVRPSAVMPKKVSTLRDSVTKLAMQFEPAAFDRKASPNSSVIGLLIGRDGRVLHHSRITVGNDQHMLIDLMPSLFTDVAQTDRAPTTMMAFVDGAYGQRNIQAVAVFLEKPTIR